jgi:hypothetical protein
VGLADVERERAHESTGVAARWAQPNSFIYSKISLPWVQFVKWQNYSSQTPKITKIFGVVE